MCNRIIQSFSDTLNKIKIVNDDGVCVSGFAEQLPNGAGQEGGPLRLKNWQTLPGGSRSKQHLKMAIIRVADIP
jgi:hypothetical protein